MIEAIFFNSKSDRYSEFSNFSNHGFTVPIGSYGGVYYPTVEHFFQCMKFYDIEYVNAIRLASTPAEAKRLGKSREYRIRDNWDSLRIEVMMQGIKYKFEQNPELKELLLSTGYITLVEDSTYDYFWGCGKNRLGENNLGKLLMSYRDYLRESASS